MLGSIGWCLAYCDQCSALVQWSVLRVVLAVATVDAATIGLGYGWATDSPQPALGQHHLLRRVL